MSLPDFESLYAGAGGDLERIPWARLRPDPGLLAWLDSRTGPTPARPAPGLVVGCGLGDDAEELARRGWRVAAFDLSPTAIDLARERFPASAVDYGVADLFALEPTWHAGFQLVVEIRNLQSIPRPDRDRATASLAACVGPGGLLYAGGICAVEPGSDRDRPWPLTPAELAGFERAGLEEVQVTLREPRADADRGLATFRSLYRRPS